MGSEMCIRDRHSPIRPKTAEISKSEAKKVKSYRPTDRQTDRQTDRPTDRPTNPFVELLVAAKKNKIPDGCYP